MGNKIIDPNFIDDEKKIPKTNLLKTNDKSRSGSKHRKDSVKLDKSKMKKKKKNVVKYLRIDCKNICV